MSSHIKINMYGKLPILFLTFYFDQKILVHFSSLIICISFEI